MNAEPAIVVANRDLALRIARTRASGTRRRHRVSRTGDGRWAITYARPTFSEALLGVLVPLIVGAGVAKPTDFVLKA